MSSRSYPITPAQACGAYAPTFGSIYNFTTYASAGTTTPMLALHCYFQLYVSANAVVSALP